MLSATEHHGKFISAPSLESYPTSVRVYLPCHISALVGGSRFQKMSPSALIYCTSSGQMTQVDTEGEAKVHSGYSDTFL